MKILYFSDSYANNVMGTKLSIRKELERRGHKVNYHSRDKVAHVCGIIAEEKPDQVWLVHSGLTINHVDKAKIEIPVIGFGFSDPHAFLPNRLDNYDAYVTNHWDTYKEYGNGFPTHYNPTSCDFTFHKDMELLKDRITFIGLAHHPVFKNPNDRIDIIHRLREDGIAVIAYGVEWENHTWNHGPISGNEFLRVINVSIIGLDIQDSHSPMAHRMFEYAACGIPVITRRRPEVFRFFDEGTEILTYDTYAALREHLCKSKEEFAEIGVRARARCFKEHNISHRVNKLLEFVEKVQRR